MVEDVRVGGTTKGRADMFYSFILSRKIKMEETGRGGAVALVAPWTEARS
jgi:hypothetical protein